MARTHNASGLEFVRSDAPPAPELPVPARYVADATTFGRNMEAYELALLVDMWLRANAHPHGLSLRLSLEGYAKLNGDMKRHFRPSSA